ncbi:MAG: calycin-like domain-containing protein [Bacteroidales bacterium]|nr:calycin-like domain-containing protein [Bacteroidales bacterium]
MKKFLLSILALCLASTAAIAQTSDAVKASAGLYTGDLYVSFDPINEETEVTGQQTVELTADGASTIQFALRNFAFGDLQLGDIIIPAIEVALQNSKVSFGEKEALRMTLGKGETAIDCAVKILSTSSQIENNKLVVNLDITWFVDGSEMPIYVRFVGNKVEASAAVKASVGDYNGDLYVSFDPINEETEVTAQQTVELTAAGANSINFALRNFSFGDLQLGDIVIPNMPVSMNGTKVTFGDMEPLRMLLGEGETAIDCTVKIDPATSYVENHVLFVNLDIVWFQDGGEIPIYVRFNSSEWVGLQHVSIAKKTGRIYSIDGRYAGNSLEGLSRGIYVQDGKKIYVK